MRLLVERTYVLHFATVKCDNGLRNVVAAIGRRRETRLFYDKIYFCSAINQKPRSEGQTDTSDDMIERDG